MRAAIVLIVIIIIAVAGLYFFMGKPEVSPEAPVLLSPSDASTTTDNTPTLEWECGENADQHRLLVGDDADLSSPIVNCLLGGSDDSYTIPPEDALPLDTYYWEVIAIADDTENPSDVWSFTIVAENLPSEIEGIVENHEASGKVAIYHWWTAGGEEQGFEAATDVLADEYPNINIIPTPVAGGAGGAMVTKIKTEIIGGNPPETFQCHAGYEMYPYYEAEALQNLSDLWEYAGLDERVPEVVADMCAVGGEYYVIPIGIHRTNVVWYNKQVFEDCGVEPPSDPVTWDKFWALCDELQSKLPEGKYPLALADREDWPATQIFETIMLGTNPQTYEDFINGTVTAEQLVPVLEQFKKYISYVTPDHRSWTWGEGCGNLLAGDCAMYLHGDWVKGFFTTRGWTCGDQYGYFTAPGTSDWFGLCVDSFVAANNSECPNNALRWLYSYTLVDAQKGFNPIKGSVSPYEDVPLGIYDNYSRMCAEDLYNPITKFYPSIAHGSGSPWGVSYDLHRKVADFAMHPSDVEWAAETIANLVQGVDHPLVWDIE